MTTSPPVPPPIGTPPTPPTISSPTPTYSAATYLGDVTQVLINSVPYWSYGDVGDADAYLNAKLDATNWQSIPVSDETTKPRALVSATRWLDSIPWQGQQLDPNQPLQWPRTVGGSTNYYTATTPGVTYPLAQGDFPTGQLSTATTYGGTAPAQIYAANFELASMLVDNPTLRADLANPMARELRAGTVSISYFRPIGAGGQDVQFTLVLPKIVMDLVKQWIAGSGTYGTPIISGTTGKAKDQPFDFQHGF